jgi:hypothetical protein
MSNKIGKLRYKGHIGLNKTMYFFLGPNYEEYVTKAQFPDGDWVGTQNKLGKKGTAFVSKEMKSSLYFYRDGTFEIEGTGFEYHGEQSKMKVFEGPNMTLTIDI